MFILFDLVIQAKPFLEKNSMLDIVDPRLGNEFDPTEMKRVMLTASLCIHHIAKMRPDMTRVWYLILYQTSCQNPIFCSTIGYN